MFRHECDFNVNICTNLLCDSAQLHCDVPSRVSYSDHYSLFIPPLLRSLVVAAVKVLPLESINA